MKDFAAVKYELGMKNEESLQSQIFPHPPSPIPFLGN
jgi:hypothetical protein